MYYVYALQSKIDLNWLYIGYSSDLQNRLKEHCDGKVKSTKSKRPLRLVYYEAYLEKQDVRRREYQLKQHKPKSDLKNRISSSLNRAW